MPLSYEQAKDQIAKKYGYSNWKALRYILNKSDGMFSAYSNEAAELYADSVARDAWDRACEAMRKEIQTQHIYSISNVPKPEYQPK